MRRSTYPNLRFPKGTCLGMCMELAPGRACMPGPASLPLRSVELSDGVWVCHQPVGERRGCCPVLYTALGGGSIPEPRLGQWLGCSCVAPDSCPGGVLGQIWLSLLCCRGRICTLLAPRLRGGCGAGAGPSAASEVMAKRQGGLQGWALRAGPCWRMGPTAPPHCRLPTPRPAAGDKNTNESLRS